MGSAHLQRVQRPAQFVQSGDLALLLREPLNHPHTCHGLLNMRSDIRGLLLGRPGRRENRALTPQTDDDQDRRHDHRSQRHLPR